jgi:proteic killer suppression protein
LSWGAVTSIGYKLTSAPNRNKQDFLAECKDMHYTSAMIESFVHKGLEELFARGKSAKIQKALAERALRRLDAIDAAKTPEALNIPGFDFHGLQGKPKRYSVHVNGPWCITFEWQGENAMKLDFENYH